MYLFSRAKVRCECESSCVCVCVDFRWRLELEEELCEESVVPRFWRPEGPPIRAGPLQLVRPKGTPRESPTARENTPPIWAPHPHKRIKTFAVFLLASKKNNPSNWSFYFFKTTPTNERGIAKITKLEYARERPSILWFIDADHVSIIYR